MDRDHVFCKLAGLYGDRCLHRDRADTRVFHVERQRQNSRVSNSFLPEDRPFLQGIGEEMNKQLENYVRGKFVELTLAGIATYILFSVFDLNYAALLAFLVGLSVIIPYLGIAVVTVPVLVIALMQFGLGGSFWSLMAGYILIQVLDGMLLVPFYSLRPMTFIR